MTKKAVFAAGAVGVAAWAASVLLFGGGGRDDLRYRTAAVTRGNVEAVISTTGELEPVTQVDIGAEVSGQVSKIRVDFNSPVRKGDVLAELDRTPFEDAVKEDEANLKIASAALDKARMDLDTAKKKYDRTLALYNKKLVSQEDKEADEEAYLEAKGGADAAEAGVKEAAAELETSRLNLAKTLIRSPLDGIVLTRNVDVGQAVAAGYQVPVLFTIADDMRKMRVKCDVDEADVGRVKEGQSVEFTVEAFPSDVFAGRILEVEDDAETDSDVVRYPTLCEVDNAQGKLRPGMTATVTIHVGEARGVLRVPNAALKFVPSSLTEAQINIIKKAAADLPAGQAPSIVWTLDRKGRLVPVVIKTGLAGLTDTEVAGGDLKEGQAVVTGAGSSPAPSAPAGRFLLPRGI
ncbi:MAG: efflux RND transporter periplasmic adaptor subunit [Acidobacteriota bacterium]